MCIRKKLLAIAGTAVLLLGTSVMAQDAAVQAQAPAEEAVAEEEETASAEEVAPAEVAVPEPAQAPEPAVEQEAAPVVAVVEPPKADKPKLEVTPYGTASYRFRERIRSSSVKDGDNGTALDYLNLLGWNVGLKAKVDDKLSLQFQIGNDWNAGEEVNWRNNNGATAGSRLLYLNSDSKLQGFQNLIVHLAYATWNPGPINLNVGVIPVSSNGTLDLLERSLTTGSYNESVYQGWSSQFNNSIIGIKLGAPILKDDIKLSFELASSVIETRSQYSSPTPEEPNPNPTAVLLIADLPIVAGDFKLTPEFTTVLNRRFAYDAEDEKGIGDHEILFGAAASYKISSDFSVSLSGAYGQNSNEATAHVSAADTAKLQGMLVGIGGSYKVGPGTIQLDYKYGSHVNAQSDDTKKASAVYNHYIDPRYTIKLHDKFTVAPRCRVYISTYHKDLEAEPLFTEIRPEIILTGSF